MSEANDLKGLWNGSYRYSASEDIGDSPFKAKLACKDGTLTGLVIEPKIYGDGEVKAKINGTHQGSAIHFEKRYMSDHEDYSRVVTYDGRVGADGQNITGTWSHSDGSGTFEMRLGS